MRFHVDRETIAVRISGVLATQVTQIRAGAGFRLHAEPSLLNIPGGEGVALCLRQNRQMLKCLGPTGF